MIAVTVLMLSLLLFRGGISRPVGAMFLATFVAYTALQYYGVEDVMRSLTGSATTAETLPAAKR